MPKRLSKEQSRQRWQKIRDLWCKWDPIGVMGYQDWLRGEYDSYLGNTLRLLEAGASTYQITDYLESVAFQGMGLSSIESPAKTFALELQSWFTDRWNDTIA